VFELVVNDPFFVHNVAALFTGLEISFGGVTVSTPLQHYLMQQKISRKSKKEMTKVARGIGLKYCEFGSTFSFRDDGAGNTTYKPILWLHDNNNPANITASANVNTTSVGLVNR
jgi:hypothetical protein